MDTNQDIPATPETPSPEVKSYQRRKLVAEIASLVVSLVFLAAMALLAGPRINRWVVERVGDSRWLRLIALALVYGLGSELLSLPISFWSGFLLEHRYQLSNQTLGGWAWRKIKGYLVGMPIGLGLLVGFYALIWYSGAWWWVWAALGWLAVSLVLGQLLPVLILPLFYKVTLLDNQDLMDRLKRLAEGTGLNVEGIYRLHLSDETKKANAALAGLGRTRRVLLGDTLLDSFTPEEIEVVFAHEVGHHVHRHILKMIAVGVVLTGAGFWLVDRVLRNAAEGLGYPAFPDSASLPLVILTLTVFGLILTPAQNALSRFYEHQCDRYALERTRNQSAYRSAFMKLANMNKADPDPHPLVVCLFEDHPPISQRLATADHFTSAASTPARSAIP